MRRLILISLVLTLSSGVFAGDGHAATPALQVPLMWDDSEIARLELPLAEPAATPKAVAADYYYRITVQPIYRTYPVYRPGKEPPGYFDRLLQQEPQVLWDDRDVRPKLDTEADWLAAGQLVFDAPLGIGNGRMGPSTSTANFLREPRWYEQTGTPATAEGVVPFYQYVIREKGKVEVGTFSCAMCHTRVMPGGSSIRGAQGNFPFGRAFARDMLDEGAILPGFRGLERLLFAAPWVRPNPQPDPDGLTLEQLSAPHAAVPAGVLVRHGTGPWSPVQVPDLIGIKGRRYLDRTGLQRHRGPVDLMRYAALNQTADTWSTYQGKLTSGQPQRDPPERVFFKRYSDEQLYALALYLYSLKPPPNPNLPTTPQGKELVERGQSIFMDPANRCSTCHDPKQGYTNNKLVAAPGFMVPAGHPERERIMTRRVGTDPTLAMTTRRGTGLYKVPSLLGVWYRGPFEHNGSCATLEDWFDPRRLRDDYVPTGWKGLPGTTVRAVKGHEFGLDLSAAERRALIAFLRTL